MKRPIVVNTSQSSLPSIGAEAFHRFSDEVKQPMSRRIGSQSLRDERLIEWRGNRWKRERRATHLDLTTQTFFPLSLIPFSHPPTHHASLMPLPPSRRTLLKKRNKHSQLKRFNTCSKLSYWRKDNRITCNAYFHIHVNT